MMLDLNVKKASDIHDISLWPDALSRYKDGRCGSSKKLDLPLVANSGIS